MCGLHMKYISAISMLLEKIQTSNYLQEWPSQHSVTELTFSAGENLMQVEHVHVYMSVLGRFEWVRVTDAMMKHYDIKQHVEERAYFA